MAHSRDLRKNKKTKNKKQHVWARPIPAEAADLFQNLCFVVVFVFV